MWFHTYWVVSLSTLSSELHEIRNRASFVLGSYSSNTGPSMFKILPASGLYRFLHSVESVRARNPALASLGSDSLGPALICKMGMIAGVLCKSLCVFHTLTVCRVHVGERNVFIQC